MKLHRLTLSVIRGLDPRISEGTAWVTGADEPGRHVLDLHGEDRSAWPANDALCSSLQVLNHLQDCGKDLHVLNRSYLPEDMLAEAGASVADVLAPEETPGLREVFGRR